MGKHRESPEIAAFIRRMFRALERRAATGDLEAVEALAALAKPLSDATRNAGLAAWSTGYSYTDLADALGISRQAARQRFASLDRPAANGGLNDEGHVSATGSRRDRQA